MFWLPTPSPIPTVALLPGAPELGRKLTGHGGDRVQIPPRALPPRLAMGEAGAGVRAPHHHHLPRDPGPPCGFLKGLTVPFPGGWGRPHVNLGCCPIQRSHDSRLLKNVIVLRQAGLQGRKPQDAEYQCS